MRTLGHQNTKLDFQFWFEFAMRSMSHQNKTFDFQYCFKFAMITSGPCIIWLGVLIINTR